MHLGRGEVSQPSLHALTVRDSSGRVQSHCSMALIPQACGPVAGARDQETSLSSMALVPPSLRAGVGTRGSSMAAWLRSHSSLLPLRREQPGPRLSPATPAGPRDLFAPCWPGPRTDFCRADWDPGLTPATLTGVCLSFPSFWL